MNKSKRLWIGLVITAVTLYISFQGVQFDEVLAALGKVNYIYVIPAVIFFWISYGSRVFRWQLLFYPYHLRWGKVLSTLSIGYFLSNITPLRIGDFVRAYLIANIERVPVARALSSVVVERTMDGLSIVFFLIMLFPFIPNIPDQARSAGLIVGVVGVAVLIALAILSLQRERGISILRRLAAPIPFLKRESLWQALDHLIDGFAVLHSARIIGGVILWSLVIWFFGAVINWIGLRAMGLDLGLDAGILVMVATSLAVTAAPTPGQFGVFHLAAQFALTTVYGIDKSVALAFAFVIHAYVYVWLMLLGTFFIWREGLSYGQLQKVEATATTAQSPSL